MADKPVVSIVVPVYNVDKYLEECMRGLMGQTLKEIEIICVDDCSSDGSLAILEKCAAADPRVQVIRHTECLTAAQARKDGALASKGEFVLFIDPDDLLAVNACERLVKEMRSNPVDMLHFGAKVEAVGDVPEVRVKNMEQMLLPGQKPLRDASLIDACFVEEQFGYQLWNKLLRGDAVREAMADCPDGRFPKAQDLLAFYLIALHMHSYRGIGGEPLYTYRLGAGITGGATFSHRQIQAYASQALVPDAIDAYLAKKGLTEKYAASAKAVRDRLCRDTVSRLSMGVAREDLSFAWDAFCGGWGCDQVVGCLADNYYYKEHSWAELLTEVSSLKYEPRPVRTIGTFYHSLYNGGAQRVVAMLCEVWVRMGYRVIVFTDKAATPDDYALPKGVKRVALGDPERAREKLAARARKLMDACREAQVDLFVYQAWISPQLFWDMLAIKATGAGFAVHCHNVFSMPLLSASTQRAFFSSPAIYGMADGVMTLSRADTAYWRTVNPRVFTVKNPVFIDVENTPVNSLNGKTVLWLGRMAREKRPAQAVEIMMRVLSRMPDARLLMVGSGSEQMEQAVQEAILRLGVKDRVEVCGFQSDVSAFYQRADVFLCTSEYEGSPLTLLEAQSFGLPVVSYRMDYLSILESGLGSVQVDQQNKDAAAEAIVRLLGDDELRRSMGRDARRNVEENMLCDLPAQWAEIFAAMEQPAVTGADRYERVMLETLRSHLPYSLRMKQPDLVGDGFIPMPTKGPLKLVRKKAATFLRVLLIDGFSGVKELLMDVKRRSQK